MPRFKIPRSKCRRCGKRRYTPGAVIYNGGQNIQGICRKCLNKEQEEDTDARD